MLLDAAPLLSVLVISVFGFGLGFGFGANTDSDNDNASSSFRYGNILSTTGTETVNNDSEIRKVPMLSA